MENKSLDTMGKRYSVSDAAEVLAVKPEMLLRALTYLPSLRMRYDSWTIADLAQLDTIIKTQIIPAERGLR